MKGRGKAARHRDEIATSRERCKRFHDFIREAWHVLEPGTEFVPGWHIDAVADHCEAVSRGEITRLQINEPPGCMKSLAASVLWPAWEWGPFGRSDLRYLTTSYLESYARRDARRMRDLVLSEWYQARWPVEIVRDGEADFENARRGGRRAMPFASLTAGRGNRVIVDDPHSTETAESDAVRDRARRIFRESVTSRLSNPVRDAIIVIMHRLHPKDICGLIEELGLDYVKLILAMEFETDRRCVTRFFCDPRTIEGALLFPERFPKAVLDRDKRALGSHAYAGQYQQRPTAREGGLFKRHWFDESAFVKAAPVRTSWVRHWDLAASSRASGVAFTAGVKLGRSPDGTFYVGDVKRDQLEGVDVRKLILSTAITDGENVAIGLPQDPGQAGKAQAQDLVRMLARYNVRAEPETGSKEQRAIPAAAQAEAGNLKIVVGAWNEAFLDELCRFPAGATKDQVDALSGAFLRLTSNNIQLWIDALGQTAEAVGKSRAVDGLHIVPRENFVAEVYRQTLQDALRGAFLCKRCGMAIVRGAPYVSDGEHQWHPECFGWV